MKITIPWRSMSVLVLVGAGMGLAFNALRPDPIPWIAQAKATVNLEDLAAPTSDAGATSAPEAEPATEAGEAQPEARTGAVKTPVPTTSEPATQVPATSAPATPVPAPRAAEAEPPVRKEIYPDIPEADVPIKISLEKAKDFYDRHGLLILDARDAEEYGEGHIEGAQSASFDDKVADSEWMEKTVKDPRPILVYCSGGECELSQDLADEICRVGHRRVMILTAGYADWKEAGYPTATGVTP